MQSLQSGIKHVITVQLKHFLYDFIKKVFYFDSSIDI